MNDIRIQDHLGSCSVNLQAEQVNCTDWGNSLYKAVPEEKMEKTNLKFIPYVAWLKCGSEEMNVWTA